MKNNVYIFTPKNNKATSYKHLKYGFFKRCNVATKNI